MPYYCKTFTHLDSMCWCRLHDHLEFHLNNAPLSILSLSGLLYHLYLYFPSLFSVSRVSSLCLTESKRAQRKRQADTIPSPPPSMKIFIFICICKMSLRCSIFLFVVFELFLFFLALFSLVRVCRSVFSFACVTPSFANSFDLFLFRIRSFIC